VRELLACSDGVTVASLAWDSGTLLILGAEAGTGAAGAGAAGAAAAGAGAAGAAAAGTGAAGTGAAGTGAAGAAAAGAGAECRTVVSLSPTDEGVAGIFVAEDFGLSAEPPLFSGGPEGRSGLVTPPAVADGRSVDAGGGVAPETGDGIGLVVDVADGRGAGDAGRFELSDPDESDDFEESLEEPEEAEGPEEESLPFWSAAFGSVPFLPAESDFGSDFFRTTVSG
jgi:PPE-repeat protein